MEEKMYFRKMYYNICSNAGEEANTEGTDKDLKFKILFMNLGQGSNKYINKPVNRYRTRVYDINIYICMLYIYNILNIQP